MFQVRILEDSFFMKRLINEEQEYAEDGTDRSHQEDEPEREHKHNSQTFFSSVVTDDLVGGQPSGDPVPDNMIQPFMLFRCEVHTLS